MKKSTILMALAVAAVPVAHADDVASDAIYAVHVWGVPAGTGMGIVVGPIHPGTCQSTGGPLLNRAESNMSIPPDWSLQVNVCLTKDRLPIALNGPFVCNYVTSEPYKGAKYTRIWQYSCIWRSW